MINTKVLFLTAVIRCLAVAASEQAAGTCSAPSEQGCSDEQREARCSELASHHTGSDVVATLAGDSWCYCSHGTAQSCDDVCSEYAKHDEQARRACTSVCPDYWRCMELIGQAPSLDYDYNNGGSRSNDAATKSNQDSADGALLWTTKKSDVAGCPHGAARCERNQNGHVPAQDEPLEGFLFCARLAVATAVLCVYYFVLPPLINGRLH